MFRALQCMRIVPQSSALFITPSRLAGHSHWQNVKAVKDAKDKEKSSTASQFAKQIMAAVKEGGSNNPAINSSLSRVIANAKTARVPKSTIDRILEADNITDPTIIEVKGAGGIFVLVETCSKNVKRERGTLTSVVKKFGCDLQDGGKIMSEFFTHSGIILIKSDGKQLISLDAATDIGIEVGAEDVEEIVVDDEVYYQFRCSPNDLNAISERLTQRDLNLLESETRYFPNQTVQVTSDTVQILSTMYEKINLSLDAAGRIFDNVEVLEENSSQQNRAT